MTATGDWTPQYCEDAADLPAPADRAFDALLDIGTWNDWWVTMRFAADRPGPLAVGSRIVFDGGVSRWTVEVIRIDHPHSIALRYVDGDLLGETEWRVAPAPGGCRVAYVYHGVRANADRAAATFGTFGTRLHALVMQADPLDGLARKLAGAPLDQAWRGSVRAAVTAGRAALMAGAAT